MKPIFISGLVNIETTVPVKRFPVGYQPVDYLFHGIESNVSGVGFNISAALKALGAEPCLWSVTGMDINGDIITRELKSRGIAGQLFPMADQTSQSVVLYDETGARMIYCDLKDLQDTAYPADKVASDLPDTDLAVVCNINFSRALLKPLKDRGVCIATDVHVLSDIHDGFNAEFMQAADILFLSNENIAGREHDFITDLAQTYDSEVIVIGLGASGALMYIRRENSVSHFPAVYTREVANTVGAGDALFACFLHYYHISGDPRVALAKAMVFASWKIGEKGASRGFLSAPELEHMT